MKSLVLEPLLDMSSSTHPKLLSTHFYCAESAASKASAQNGKSSESPPHGPEQSAEMLKQRESAEAVFAALFKAQEAASAAAKASGNTVQTS